MNKFSEYMDTLPKAVKALIATLMALVFSYFVIYDLMSVSYFAPMEKAADFTFGDFYTLVASDRPIERYEDGVIIVNVDGCSEKQLAQTINAVDSLNPSAVGLDMVFSGPSCSEGSDLANALAHCRNLVMPVYISEDGKVCHISGMDSVVTPSGGFAAINIQGESDSRTTVRNFLKKIDSEDIDIKPLPVSLVTIARPEMIDKLYDNRDDEVLIRYSSIVVDSIYHSDVKDYGDLIKGRIVLIGKVKDYSDMHDTPISNYTPGILIHALSVATILSGEYTWTPNKLEKLLLGAVLCYIIVLINFLLGDLAVKPLIVRFIQLLILYLMIVGGSLAFIHYNVNLNFSYPIMTVTLGVAACEIYGGIFDKHGLLDLLVKAYNNSSLKIHS